MSKKLGETTYLIPIYSYFHFVKLVLGKRSNVIHALKLLREQFPLDQYPDLTLAQLNTPTTSPLHQLPLSPSDSTPTHVSFYF